LSLSECRVFLAVKVIVSFTHLFNLVLHDASIFYFCLSFSDHALPGYSGGGGQSSGGTEGDGRNPAICIDRQTPAKTDMERQVTQRTANFVPSIGL